MKSMNKQSRILWRIGLLGLLGIFYWLSRYAFFDLHGMKQWPDLLALLSLGTLIIIYIFSSKGIMPIAAVSGYMGGFIIAMIFNRDGVDPGGGRTNNAWIIWGGVFVVSLLVGTILTFRSKRVSGSNGKNL